MLLSKLQGKRGFRSSYKKTYTFQNVIPNSASVTFFSPSSGSRTNG